MIESVAFLRKKEKLRWGYGIFAILFVLVGVNLYNLYFPYKTTLSRVIFMLLASGLLWLNKPVMQKYFKNPFRKWHGKYPISDVLWLYPFWVLIISVILLMIPMGLGIFQSDPQGVDQMTYTISEYLSNVATLPLVVFQEESFNVLMMIMITALIPLKGRSRIKSLIVAILVSMIFGANHMSAWGLEAALHRMIIHIPFIYTISYYETAWISMLAHFYQNGLTHTSVIIDEFSTYFVGVGGLLCVIIILFRGVKEKAIWQ